MKTAATGAVRRFSPAPAARLSDDPDEVVSAIIDPTTRGELYPLYDRLRQLAPVHRTSVAGLPPGCWLLTSYAGVDRVARAGEAVNDPKTVAVFDHDGERGPFFRTMANAMLFLDKPNHDRVRRLVYRAFTPRAVSPLGSVTEQVANDILNAIEADGEMELVDAFSYPLPIRAICQLLGLPSSAQEEIEAWTWDFARAGDPMTVTPALGAAGDAAALAFHGLFDRLLADRRAHPTDDIMSALVTADEHGERLSQDEAIATCILLLQAGHETTTDLLGNAVLHLLRNPAERDWLVNHLNQIRPAVEELLRYDCSVQMSMRLITADLAVLGTVLPAGSLAALFYGAANRDPARFECPDRLDLRRQPVHLAFSAGAYYCLGNALARTELAAGLSVLLRRLPHLEPAGETFVQRRSLRMRGPQELRVRWKTS